MNQVLNRVDAYTDTDNIAIQKSRSWDKLKQWIQTQEYDSRGKNYGMTSYIYTKIIRKMNELEQEAKINEKSKV